MRKLPLAPSLSFPALTSGTRRKARSPAASEPAVPPSIHEKTAEMKHLDGLIPLDWDAKNGKLYLEIPARRRGWQEHGFHLRHFPALWHRFERSGPRPRTSLGGTHCSFERSGPKVLLVQPNLAFRTSSSDTDEQLAVSSRSRSRYCGVSRLQPSLSDGAVLVDATDFFLHDAHGVADRLTRT